MTLRLLRRAARRGAALASWCSALLVFGICTSGLGTLGCGSGASVPRVMHGRTVEGPVVSDVAYAAYARGAYLEARGERAAAIAAYRAALTADGDGAATWTRLGVLYCADRPAAADDAFGESIALAPRYATAWSSRAECRRSRGELEAALADALRAVGLAPDDTSANLLVARLYQEQRRVPEAKAWLLGLVLRAPEPSEHWAALAALAEATSDPALARHARSGLAEREARRERGERPARTPPEAPSQELLAALREQDLPRIDALAARQRIDARTLALLAAAHGSTALAEQQASLVLAADPSDPDALLAVLTTAASAGDSARLASLLEGADGERRPGSLGARAMTDLLRWLVSEEAATAWARAYGARTPR
jgi:tetratricopeptide (TPR) repeat protein